MSDLKTQKNDGDVRAFLASVEHDRRREDAFTILEIMEEITGEKPSLWGTSIVGFGEYSYSNTTGKNYNWFAVGFSPRKQSMTVYIMDGFDGYDTLMGKLGKHKTGKSCLYINKLDDVDMSVLRELIRESYQFMNGKTDRQG